MPGDFNGCRFDFRLDSKKGLTPARRKGHNNNSGRNGVLELGTSTENRQLPASCSTLYTCKQCGVLLSSRPLLIEHRQSCRNRLRNVTLSAASSATTSPSAMTGSERTSSPAAHVPLVTSPALNSCEGRNNNDIKHGADGKPCESLIQRYINTVNTQLRPKQSAPADDVSELHRDRNVSSPQKQSKCRLLNETVDRLWKQKLKVMLSNVQIDSSAAKPGDNREPPRAVADHKNQQLYVRRITASPGLQPRFYTSLMRLQTSRQKQRLQNRKLLKSKKSSCGDNIGFSLTTTSELIASDLCQEDSPGNQLQVSSEKSSDNVCVREVSVSAGGASNYQYACDFNGCKRMFRKLKHLKVHRMQHTNERPLACKMCNYSCRQRNSLNWHMKSRHGLNKRVTSDGRTVYG